METDIIQDWAFDISDLFNRACSDDYLDGLEIQRLHYYVHLFKIALEKKIVLAEDMVCMIPNVEKYLNKKAKKKKKKIKKKAKKKS